jgi:uncharacterized protein (TIGR02594 family)
MQWLTIARKYVGTAELPGPKNNPTIMGWIRALGGTLAGWVVDETTPWCASSLNAILQEAGLPMSAKPGSADLLRAKSFLSYGTALTEPSVGCIIVFDRAGGGHVGLYTGETLKAYRVLGGNQSNKFCEAWLARDRALAYRWPPGAAPPTLGRKFLLPDGKPLSVNEQ